MEGWNSRVVYEENISGQSQAKVQNARNMDWDQSCGDLVFIDGKLKISWQCMLVAQKATTTVGCLTKSVTSRWREVILPLYSALARPHLECSVQLWGPLHMKGVVLLQWIHKEALNWCRPGAPHDEDRLRQPRLFSLEQAQGTPLRSPPKPKGGWKESWTGTFDKGI